MFGCCSYSSFEFKDKDGLVNQQKLDGIKSKLYALDLPQERKDVVFKYVSECNCPCHRAGQIVWC